MKGLLQKQAAERVGRVLSGKWRLETLLGVGGMGAVYRASHLRNGVEVAIKVLNFEVGEAERKRFVREGYAANLVAHPGVVSVLDDGDDAGSLYLVMELLDGKNLKEVWQSHELAIPYGVLYPIVVQILEILVASHAKGVVHRDIKPDNVFIESSGAVRLIDFGIAGVRDRAGEELTSTSATLGTPAYMSPEQARSRWDEVDARSDLFSLGASVYRMLTGHGIHEREGVGQLLVAIATEQAPSIRETMPELPDALAGVIDRALEFDLEKRFQTAADMLAAWKAAGAELSLDEKVTPPEKTETSAKTDEPIAATHTIETPTNVAKKAADRTVDSTRADANKAAFTRAELQALAQETGPEKSPKKEMERAPESITVEAMPVRRRSRVNVPLVIAAVLAGGGAGAAVFMLRAPKTPPPTVASVAKPFPGSNATLEDVGDCADGARCGPPRSWACKSIWPLGLKEGIVPPGERLCGTGTPYVVAPHDAGEDYCGLPVRVCEASGACKEIRVVDVAGGTTIAWGGSPGLLDALRIPHEGSCATRANIPVKVTTGAWSTTRDAAKEVVVEAGQSVDFKFEPKQIGDHAVEFALVSDVPGAKTGFCWASDASPAPDCWSEDATGMAWTRRLLWSGSVDVHYVVRFIAPAGSRAVFRHREYQGFQP